MNLNQQIAVLTLRLLLGMIFLMQGIGKVFRYGVENVYQNYFYGTYSDLLPEFLLRITAWYTSYTELICGFLVLIGLFRNYALYNPFQRLDHCLFWTWPGGSHLGPFPCYVQGHPPRSTAIAPRALGSFLSGSIGQEKKKWNWIQVAIRSKASISFLSSVHKARYTMTDEDFESIYSASYQSTER